jgi:hypothetical protein
MAEPLPGGLLARYATPERLVEAARGAREAGVQGLDAFTPFPVDDLNPILGLNERTIPKLGLIGGITGAAAAYAMQIATNLDYPIDIGGRPLIAVQAFALIGFELTVLFSVGFMVVGFFILNRLPRYHRPLFAIPAFEHATRDGFFLFVPTPDADALGEARELLGGADGIAEIPQ